jgi:hypothetical protein
VKEAVQRAGLPSLTGLVRLPLPYLATFGGFLISLLIGGIGLIGNEQGLLFRLTNRVSGEPVWAPEIAAGLLIGWVAYKRFPSRFAFLSFAVPAMILVWSAVSWQRTMSQYDSTWDTFFGTGCGGSECPLPVAHHRTVLRGCRLQCRSSHRPLSWAQTDKRPVLGRAVSW